MNSKFKKHILFYPQKPSRNSVAYKIAKKLELGITTDIQSDFNWAVNWEDVTYRQTFSTLENLNSILPVVNIGCKDISKQKIDECFNNVFDYRLNYKSATFEGYCLQKSNLNAIKDGVIVKCPTKMDSKYVYQRVINNLDEESNAEDIRVPVFKNCIPFLFLKYRSVTKRFSDDFDRSQIVMSSSIFSASEIEKILTFCRHIGLEYGELDVLRDRINGKIYIVDANNTPWGPPDELCEKESNQVIEVFSQIFQQKFISIF